MGLAAALLLARSGVVAAFPLIDATNADQVPQGTELAAPDVQGLRHQLQLVNGLGAPVGGGWTFVPRMDWQEELTDNVFQAHSPRRADLVSFFAPGISIAGDLPRIQMTFDFSPTLSLYARNADLNSLTEQLNGIASVTVVPDLAYVDVRAVAGVHNAYGGIGGLGGVGAPAGAAATPAGAIPTLAGNTEGLNKNNEIQTTSFAVSPYLLRRFGDWGVGKLGYSASVTQSDAVSGFFATPFPTGSGKSAQTLISNEEIAHFATGEFLEALQDSFDIDLSQTQTTAGAGAINYATGVPIGTNQTTSSRRATITDRITYQVANDLSVFGSGGHEDITYSGFNATSVHDLVWSLGGTWVPSPFSSLSVSYGHENGFNSLTVNGYYAVTARTTLTASYGSTLGTQLENVQNQLNLAAAGANGTLINGQTGGTLFGPTNALAVQEGLFKTTTLNVGATTSLERDIYSINLLMSKQTSSGTNNSTSGDTKSVNVSWLHQMRPDMTISAAISYSMQTQSTGVPTIFNPGDNTSIAGSLAWQWQISDTLSGSVRYSFFERQSPVTTFDVYQNILIVGLSKRF